MKLTTKKLKEWLLKKIKAWSYSRWSVYDECPFKFRCQVVEGIHAPKNKAMLRGIDIHRKAEKYLKNTIKKLPVELKLFKDEFAKMRKMVTDEKAFSEEKWAFNSDWEVTEYFADDTWVRVIIDIYLKVRLKGKNILIIRDFKTGKNNPQYQDKYNEQMEIFAIAGFAMIDGVDLVKPELMYLDSGEIVSPVDDGGEIIEYYTAEDAERLKKKWNDKAKRLAKDKSFVPTPSYKCKWCHFRKDNKGPCKF